MNLCRPDDQKSCAACCGLYNVREATRPTLWKNLESRTLLFREVERSTDAIEKYAALIRRSETVLPVDNAIHVCEFTGFLDEDFNVVGCMLHPCVPGNGRVDLRGLCHYGSMACKAFYCPAWDELDPRYRTILVNTIDDWHLYGLVITDVDFVRSLFGLIESRSGQAVRPESLASPPALEIFERMLSWKNEWPFAGSSLLRQSRYYFKGSCLPEPDAYKPHLSRLLGTIGFTFGTGSGAALAEDYVLQTVEDFVTACASGPADSGD